MRTKRRPARRLVRFGGGGPARPGSRPARAGRPGRRRERLPPWWVHRGRDPSRSSVRPPAPAGRSRAGRRLARGRTRLSSNRSGQASMHARSRSRDRTSPVPARKFSTTMSAVATSSRAPASSSQACQPVADGVGGRATVAVQVHAQHAKIAELLRQFFWQGCRFEPPLDVGPKSGVDELAYRGSDVAFVVVKQPVNVEQVPTACRSFQSSQRNRRDTRAFGRWPNWTVKWASHGRVGD
jgi:hypothetical protein